MSEKHIYMMTREPTHKTKMGVTIRHQIIIISQQAK